MCKKPAHFTRLAEVSEEQRGFKRPHLILAIFWQVIHLTTQRTSRVCPCALLNLPVLITVWSPPSHSPIIPALLCSFRHSLSIPIPYTPLYFFRLSATAHMIQLDKAFSLPSSLVVSVLSFIVPHLGYVCYITEASAPVHWQRSECWIVALVTCVSGCSSARKLVSVNASPIPFCEILLDYKFLLPQNHY